MNILSYINECKNQVFDKNKKFIAIYFALSKNIRG